jgi:uncharacterized pyridoxal phosphate-containing UPF0001 family protein
MDQYFVLTLAREYISLVEAMNNGNYVDWHAVDTLRVQYHHDLCEALDTDHSVDMYRLCRNLVHDARSIGDFEYDEPD